MRKPPHVDPRFGITHLVIRGKDCTVEMWPRPPYCDRGTVEVHVLVLNEKRAEFTVDFGDMFPRLYFDLDRAKGEVRDWMECRKQLIDGEDWQVVLESPEHRAAALQILGNLQ